MNYNFKCDYYRMTGEKYSFSIKSLINILFKHNLKLMFLIRLASNKNTIFAKILRCYIYLFKRKYGIDMHPNTKIGEGLALSHAYNITINPSAIIGKNAEVRHCAFIRGNAIVGENAVVGNSTELKNVILFNNVQVPHYNYVGDSILGYKSHMGAGSITSNVKSDKKLVIVKNESEKIETGLKKFGSMLGDNVEVGCGSILNPGSVIGRNTNIYPLSSVRGVIKSNSIYKRQGDIVDKI